MLLSFLRSCVNLGCLWVRSHFEWHWNTVAVFLHKVGEPIWFIVRFFNRKPSPPSSPFSLICVVSRSGHNAYLQLKQDEKPISANLNKFMGVSIVVLNKLKIFLRKKQVSRQTLKGIFFFGLFFDDSRNLTVWLP